MKTHAFRLTKGMDLLNSIKDFCEKNNILAGVVISSVGSVLQTKVRTESTEKIVELIEEMEITSLNGTVSKNRCHLHILLSRADASVLGGHLVREGGTIINTTCEIVILELDNLEFDKEFDDNTGYNELKIIQNQSRNKKEKK